MELFFDELGTTFILLILAFIALMLVSMWKVFEKAGQPGWAAIIPIYNLYILLKIAGKPGWWMILFIIPIVNYVFIIWTYNMVSKSFGKDEGFTIGLVLLGFIFWPILAFSDARYHGPFGDRAAFEAYQQNNQFEFENHDGGNQ